MGRRRNSRNFPKLSEKDLLSRPWVRKFFNIYTQENIDIMLKANVMSYPLSGNAESQYGALTLRPIEAGTVIYRLQAPTISHVDVISHVLNQNNPIHLWNFVCQGP